MITNKFTDMPLQKLESYCNDIESKFKGEIKTLDNVQFSKKVSDHIYQAQGMINWVSPGYIVKIDNIKCIVLEMEHPQDLRLNFNVLLVVPIED